MHRRLTVDGRQESTEGLGVGADSGAGKDFRRAGPEPIWSFQSSYYCHRSSLSFVSGLMWAQIGLSGSSSVTKEYRHVAELIKESKKKAKQHGIVVYHSPFPVRPPISFLSPL
jgi:hypothetical protein